MFLILSTYDLIKCKSFRSKNTDFVVCVKSVVIPDQCKMADTRRSNFYVVFTTILCGRNFYVRYVMKMIL